MGRESTISYDQVAAEADAMIANGDKPSARGIRERLGTGSMGTIHRFLQEWREVRRGASDASAMTIPPALQRALLEFMEQELTARLAPAEARLAEQQQAANDLAVEVERQAEQILGQAEDLAHLAEEKAAVEGRAAQLEADLAATRKEATSERQVAEIARTELAKAQLRLEAMPRLEADLVAVRHDLATEHQARTVAEQSAAVNATQKAYFEARVEQMSRELTLAQTKVETLTNERDQARQALILAERDQADLERERKATREALEKAADAVGSVKILRELLDKTTAELTEIKADRR
jgi:chromosome segregation ATPase